MLADRLGAGGMPVEDTETGNVIHFDTAGQAAFRDQRSETGLVHQELTDPRITNAFPSDSTGEIRLATQAALEAAQILKKR
jgi:hypothetical protein